MVKRRYITFKVEDDLSGVISLPEQGCASEPINIRCGRCLRFCGFCCVCTSTLFQALAPWMLSVIEVLILLLLYVLLVLPYRPPGPYSFDFHASSEDVVLLGGIRAAALAATYAWGSTRQHLRPYLYSSYVCGVVVLLYVCLKAWLFSYPLAWLPPAALMTTCAAFSCLDMLAARYTVHWYRRRGQLGLLHSPSLPPSSNRQRASAASPAGAQASLLDPGGGDPPPELLADSDSCFLDVGGVRVHYKEAWPAACSFILSAGDAGASSPSHQDPALHQAADDISAARNCQQPQPSPASSSPAAAAAAAAVAVADAALATDAGVPGCVLCGADVAILLLHGFAGGEFAWRHLLQPLADAVGVRVLALDRPGFGLTTPSPAATFAAVHGSSSSRGMQRLQRHSPNSTLTKPLLPTHHPPHGQPGPSALSPSPPTRTGQAFNGDGAAHYIQQQCQQEHHQQQQRQQHDASRCAELTDPYSLAGQACIVLGFCQLLGIRRVLLVAHAEGCAVAAHSAAAAAAAAAAAVAPGQSRRHVQAQPMQQQQMQVQDAMQGRNASSRSSNASTLQEQSRQGEGQGQVEEPQVAGADKMSRGSSRGISMIPAACDAQNSAAHNLHCVGSDHNIQACAGNGQQSRCGVLVPLPPCSAVTTTVTSTCGEQANRQQQPGSLIPPYAMSASGSSGGAGSGCVEVVGLVLLHPNLNGHQLPAGVTRLLAASGLGRSVLRSLLRSEVAQSLNPRGWAHPSLVTDEVLSLYQRGLRVEGWEQRLVAACSASAGSSLRKLALQLEAVQHLPALLVTGASDAVATPDRLAGIAAVLRDVQCAVVPNCGHLSHEEAPHQLLELLVPFCRHHLTDTANAGERSSVGEVCFPSFER